MKFVKFILCAAILLSSVSGVYAANDGGVEDALRIVKERIDTSEYDDCRSSYYKEEDGTTSYSFEWTKKSDSYNGLYVGIKGGIITNYSKFDYGSDSEAGLFSLGKDEALKIAGEFFAKINPDICDSIKIVPEENEYVYADSYSMDMYRVYNGIPVLEQNGYISVSKGTHEVSYFYINYDEGISFKPSSGVIGIDAAKKAYKELMPPTLRYRFRRDYEKEEITAYLEYASDDNGRVIDAYDGSVYEIYYGDDDYRYASKNAMDEEMAEDDAGYGFTPAELAETERLAGLLSESEVCAIAENDKTVAMPYGAKLTNINLRRVWFSDSDYCYSLEYEKNNGSIGVTVDAKTGEILSFYKFSENVNGSQGRKNEEQKAQAALMALAGDKAAEFRMEESADKGYVSFIRTVEGIDVLGDGAYFGFDGDDNITSYRLVYTKEVGFPSKDGAITPDEAAEKAFDALGFELAYVINRKDKTARPVYCVGKMWQSESFTVNPFTGSLTGYDGEDIKEPVKITYSDIDGHYGKDIFTALADYGIGFEGGELKPDEPITQAEYLTLLNKAFGYEETLEGIYKQMIASGIISSDERADDSVLTRENAAIFLIREIGAEEYAKYNDIYISPFDDVLENKGYIALLKAKGILNGDGSGSFYPQRSVTRGEALIMIYNVFTK